MHTVIVRAALTSLCIMVVGCGSVTEAELPGRYSAEYEGGIDYLEIAKDGRYVHTFQLAGQQVSKQGRWEVETLASEHEDLGVTFDQFAFRERSGELGQ